MRVLYHHRTQADDAQGVHIYEMIRAFRELGHVVDLVALVELDEKREKKIRGKGWEWVARSVPDLVYELMELMYNLIGYRRLYRQIRRKRPDIIYERYSLNTFCGVWASRRFGIPIFLEINAPLCYEQQKLGKLSFKSFARFSERWICSNATKSCVVSGVMKEMLVREGVPEEKLVVTPNGINPAEFHPGVSAEKVRARYQLEGVLVIGFVGWFRKWHGLEMLLEVFHEAKLGERDARLMLIGDGPAAPELLHFVETHRLKREVIFTGPVDRKEMPAHLAAIDVALQPSVTGYASPMKLFEYMGMGKAVIAPDQPNIREILVHRETALLFTPGDKNSLKEALLEFVGSPDLRERLGRRAHQATVDRGFLWRSNAERVIGFLLDGGLAGPQSCPMGVSEERVR